MVQIVYQFCFNLCSYSAYILFDNKLELVICKLRVETFKVFYTLFEHSPLNLPPPKLTFLPMLCFRGQGLPHCTPATFSLDIARSATLPAGCIECVCPSLLVKERKGQQSSGICFGCMQQDPMDRGARQVNLCFWVQAPYTIPPLHSLVSYCNVLYQNIPNRNIRSGMSLCLFLILWLGNNLSLK